MRKRDFFLRFFHVSTNPPFRIVFFFPPLDSPKAVPPLRLFFLSPFEASFYDALTQFFLSRDRSLAFSVPRIFFFFTLELFPVSLSEPHGLFHPASAPGFLIFCPPSTALSPTGFAPLARVPLQDSFSTYKSPLSTAFHFFFCPVYELSTLCA